MATGTSYAQIPCVCSVCETSSNIQCKCLDCDQLMCTNCYQKVHAKFKSLTKHSVVPISEIGAFAEKDRKNLICKNHPQQNYTGFCKICNEAVCAECTSGLHKKHEIAPMEAYYDIKAKELTYYKDIVETEILPYCTTRTEFLEKDHSDADQTYNDAKCNILEQRDEIKRIVDARATELLKELNENFTEGKASRAKIGKQLKQRYDELSYNTNKSKITLKSENREKLTEAVTEIKTALQNPDKIKLSRNPTLRFLKGKIDIPYVDRMLGKLQKESTPEMSFSVFKVLTSDFENFNQIAVSSEDSAWVVREHLQSLFKVTFEFSTNKIKELSKTKTNVVSLAVQPSGDVLLSIEGKTKVKRLSKDGKLERFINTSPLLPQGIHVTKSNKLIIGMREQRQWPLRKKPVVDRRIRIYDEKGQPFIFIRNDQFTDLKRISTNLNGDICVCDQLDNTGRGRIVVLSPSGVWRWCYNGDTEEFYPGDLTTTSRGCIIVSDYKSNSLHVLSMNGDLHFKQDTTFLDFSLPYSLDMNNKEQLVVGCATDAKDKKGAKVVILNFWGF